MERKHLKGYIGEFIAVCLLRLKGYGILARRYKTVCGEIDIVAQKRDKVVFVEVKARKQEEKCFTAITQKQLHRIQNASQIFLKRNPQFQNCSICYDIILVADWSLPIHIENVTM